ncbi:hypothetical protein SAMN05192560_2097 [Methylobacillus rhizosphaerae]|uniref:Uncharacterized protein n=1 Tax=Methylobacillus rhizosphaerae TaxID=551994 RepID=A0A239AV11_9PROT|nr:hypothetical protein [Methylobacillus rhizosphaerae]SNR98798.1 hypothetical protein SAMN05192560_2097 [Methylobacillus rhizosphaerae]
MFNLDKSVGKLINVNPRAELHGKDTVLAVDIKVEHKLHNDILSEFHPTLKAFLYERGDDDQLELIEDKTHLTKRKFPLIPAFKYELKLSGYEVKIDFGIDDKSAIEMGGGRNRWIQDRTHGRRYGRSIVSNHWASQGAGYRKAVQPDPARNQYHLN